MSTSPSPYPLHQFTAEISPHNPTPKTLDHMLRKPLKKHP